ncbi:hypothetical protein K458DRAFT_290342, partial [Lentithecium fluviatile CBS 122367]
IASYNLSTYALVITLKATSKINNKITFLIGILKWIINLVFARAIKRGFNLY